MQRISILLSSMLLITGCIKKPVTPELNFGRYYFGYEVAGKGAKDIVQVFDDAKYTYIQTSNSMPNNLRSLRLKDIDGALLSDTPVGLFRMIEGIHQKLVLELLENLANPRKRATLDSTVTIYRLEEADFASAH